MEIKNCTGLNTSFIKSSLLVKMEEREILKINLSKFYYTYNQLILKGTGYCIHFSHN